MSAVNRVIDALMDKGCKPKKRGSGWTAHCPAHEDKSPSLSVSEGADHKVLVKCHSGCSIEAVVGGLGLKMEDLFGNGRDLSSGLVRTRHLGKAAMPTCFSIRDTEGNELARHFRKDNEDGDKTIWWEPKGIKPSELPFYGSEHLKLLEERAPLIVCEGEKAADALIQSGIAALGSVTGAAGTPCDHSLRSLLRFRVYLWPDNDAAGLEHMKRIGARLKALGADDVFCISWPEAPAKGDAYDFVESGGELETLLHEAEPFSETADLAGLLDDVKSYLNRFVVFNSEFDVVACTLWIAHTHFLEFSECSPYLAVQSAEKRCGKTRLLDVMEFLVVQPWRPLDPTEPVMFRKIDKDKPTLFLDEADTIFGVFTAKYHEGLRALLNAGNRRGVKETRNVPKGRGYELQDFEVFCPKVLASIGRLPGTIEDRSIKITLRRKKKSEPVERFRRRNEEHIASSIRLRLEEMALVVQLPIEARSIPDVLDDRAQDCWEPLLVIAEAAGGKWQSLALRAAVALSGTKEPEDDSRGVWLLSDCRRLIEDQRQKGEQGKIPTQIIVAWLNCQQESPWSDMEPKGLTPPTLARMLRKYGITPKNFRNTAQNVIKGYNPDDFVDAFDRYLPPIEGVDEGEGAPPDAE